jgi:hypothetical protein
MRAWIKRRYASYTPDGKFWLTIAVACLVVDMAIGYLAGISVGTFWHGVGYAALAAGFAFLPDAAYEEYEHRRIASAVVIAALCVPIGIKAYEQQLTYSTGVRQGEMQAVGVQNTKYSGAQDDVKRNRAELTMLMGVLETAKREAPWAATVNATGLRAQVATLEKAIEAEGSPRNGGCKRKCIDLMAQKTSVEKQIAGAEKVENTEARIKELQGIIDSKREKADNTEHKQSLNVDIAKTTASIFSMLRGVSAEEAIKADDVAIQYATLGSAGLGSLALLILSPVGFFLAGRRRIQITEQADQLSPPVGDLGNRNTETRAYPPSETVAPIVPRPLVRQPSPILTTQTVAQLRALAA